MCTNFEVGDKLLKKVWRKQLIDLVLHCKGKSTSQMYVFANGELQTFGSGLPNVKNTKNNFLLYGNKLYKIGKTSFGSPTKSLLWGRW